MKPSSPSEYRPGPRRPLVGLALAVMAGCLAGLRFPPFFLLPAAAAVILTVMAIVFRKHPAAGIAVYAALILTAAAHTSLVHHNPSRRDVQKMMGHSREYLQLMGVVTDDPESEPGFGRFQTSWSFTLKLDGVHRREQWQAARGRVFVRIALPNAAPPLRYGDRLIIDGLLKQNASPRAWLPPVSMNGEDGRARIISGGNGNRLKAWCYAGRARFSGVLSRGLENFPETRGLLEALLLGYRGALPDSLRDVFALTGTLHIFAISGLHVGVMAILIIAVLKMLGISRQYWILLLGPALVVYVMGTGLKASASRACIMALLYWSGPLFKRRPDGGSALAASALLILAADPLQIASPGFVLSFSVVAGIILFYPVFRRLYFLPLRQPRWIPGPRPRLERWGRFFAEKVADLAAVSTAAWLVSAPTTAYYFNLCSPVGLLGNIFIVPGSFLVVLTGCLSLVTGSLIPVCAEIFNHANRIFVDLLLWIVRLMSRIPHGHSYVQAPSPLLIILWYTTLSSLVFMKTAFKKLILCSLLIAAMAGVSRAWYRQDLTIDVLDVGEGNAVFMNLPGDGDMLIDTGASYFAIRVIRHLQAAGVDRLETLVLTHPDADHTGAAEAVMDRFEVGEVWVCPFKGQSEKYQRMLDKVRDRGIPLRRLERGMRGTAAGDMIWEVFSPEGVKNFRTANEASLVMRFGRKAASILFLGGAGMFEERAILRAGIHPAAGILIVGDHGSEKTTSDEWLAAVSPRFAVISVGRNNRRGDPAPAVIQRLDSRNIERWRTDLQGALRITLPDDPQAEPWIIGPVPNR